MSAGWILPFLLASVAMAGAKDKAGIRPVRLRCEYAVTPLGVDELRPLLSWELETARAGERGQRQTAYRILAASSPDRLAAGKPDIWDGGRTAGNATLGIPYGGPPLGSGQRVYWAVRVWDRDGVASGLSPASWWEMALLRPEDWRARWIARPRERPLTVRESFGDDPAPLLRKEFTVRGNVRRARAYATGLGYYELRLNGARVGDHVLDPGWTDVRKRVLYSTYDITDLLRPGRNAVGLMLGNGWYSPLPLPLFGRFDLRKELAVGEPRGLVQLVLEYGDGTRELVVSDPSWKSSAGPVVRNSVFLGEHYDARREQPGWDAPGFDDRHWKPAIRADEPLGPLQAQFQPPIRRRAAVPAVGLKEPRPGVFVFDLGRNFAGWVRLRARGTAGTRIDLRFGELVYPDGSLNPMTAVMTQLKNRRGNAAIGAPETAWQAGSFTLRGEGVEEFVPHFTFHGFRYVEVTGYPGRPAIDAVEGIPLAADLPDAGEFTCSNPMFTQLQEVVRRTLLSNVFSVQSDCPHREKLGYGGDIVAASEMAMLNFDMVTFYRKAVTDLADAVRPNGGFTETSPYVGIADEGLGEGAGPIGWGTAHPLLVWQLYQYYGDQRTLAQEFPRVERWLGLLASKSVGGILDNGISDHESLVPKPRALTGTGFYYLNLRLGEKMAAVMGRSDLRTRWAREAELVRTAFNRRFLAPGTGRYDTATQACQAFALHLGLVPEPERAAALRVLLADIEAKQGHLSTGIFGTKYMLRALSDLGRTDTAYQVADQRTFPGWGHMLANGATTLWEHWAFSDNVYSHNHPMFGSVSEWFFRGLAGINPSEETRGCERIVIRPGPVGDLTSAGAAYRSVRGPIKVGWRRVGRDFSMELQLPPGVTAEVQVPSEGGSEVLEGGRPAQSAEGIAALPRVAGFAVFELGSGNYSFKSLLPR